MDGNRERLALHREGREFDILSELRCGLLGGGVGYDRQSGGTE